MSRASSATNNFGRMGGIYWTTAKTGRLRGQTAAGPDSCNAGRKPDRALVAVESVHRVDAAGSARREPGGEGGDDADGEGDGDEGERVAGGDGVEHRAEHWGERERDGE